MAAAMDQEPDPGESKRRRSDRPRLGCVLPTMDLGRDRQAIRSFALSLDELGIDHVLCYDHVLGADPQVHAPWRGSYDVDTEFHEPMVLLGYLAAIAPFELVTFVLVLPQRQTALVAKQAAELDLLSGGGVRLGVGVGWNEVEYAALDQPFADRGVRLDEQIAALRALWTERSVDVSVGGELIHGAGLCPRPPAAIPIWIGGSAPVALARAGRLADGWMPYVVPGHGFEEHRDQVVAAAVEVGRDPASLGLQAISTLRPDTAGHAGRRWASWRSAGATHIAFDTVRSGARSLDEHLDLLARAVAQLDG
jgi:probable F420-dependent oxidoreductase